MRMPVLAGLANPQNGGQSFPPAREQAIGNDLPANNGDWQPYPVEPAPGPRSGPGYRPGGQQSGNDGSSGADPRAPHIPVHRSVLQPGWQEQLGGQAPGGRGMIGFNDQRRAVDRHVFWDTGRQLTGTSFVAAGAAPNAYNNPLQEPPVPELRTVNRTVSWQLGSDASRNDDDLSRAYTRTPTGQWAGEQIGGWSTIYGGTPGLYQPYGSRGGVPYAIHSPVAVGANGDGPQKLWSGPPHGLHTITTPNNAETLGRYGANPQMRPVRVDRPSNSPQAGQSYSQTVVVQGAAGAPTVTTKHTSRTSRVQGRGWKGTGQ
jgi:hypothetical protein